jgi:hypothetical protein
MAPLLQQEGCGPLSPGSSVIDTTSFPSPLNLHPPEIRDAWDDQHEAKLQQCWDKSIAKHLDLPDEYRNVHVLVIKWQDAIGQLEVQEEVTLQSRMMGYLDICLTSQRLTSSDAFSRMSSTR